MLSVGRWKIYLPLTLAAGFAAAWLGFRGEREQMAMGGGSPAPLRTQLRRIFVRPTDAVARLNEIRSTSRHTSMTQREEEECWLVIRDFNEEQLKNYLAELPDWHRPSADDTLTQMIFARWAEIDPLTALAEARKPPFDRQVTPMVVMTSWISRDRDAALRWATSPEGKEMSFFAGHLAGQIYVREDPATAIERLKDQFPQSLGNMLYTLAQTLGNNEDSVREYFELTAGQAKAGFNPDAVSELARTWTQNNLQQALESHETFGLSPEKLATFRENVLETAAVAQPKQVLDRLRQGQEPALAAVADTITLNILFSQPGPATEWAVENNQTELLSTVVKFQMQRREKLGSNFVAPNETLRTQYLAWQQLQPEAANQWFQQQSASGQKALTPPSADATH